MRFFLNGTEGNSLLHIRGADSVFNVLFLDDAGQPLSLVAPAEASLEFFTAETRTDSPVIKAVTPAAGAAAGFGTAVIQDDDISLARNTWYVWGKYKSNSGTGGSTLVSIGGTFSTLKVI